MILSRYIKRHYNKKDGLRLGQRFVNEYIKHPWPELFYQVDQAKTIQLIMKWMEDLQYDTLPEPPRYAVGKE